MAELIIGNVTYPSNTDAITEISNYMCPLYTIGPSQEIAIAPTGTGSGDWLAQKKLSQQRRNPTVPMALDGNTKTCGQLLSAISTGNFFGDSIVPKIGSIDHTQECLQNHVQKLSQRMAGIQLEYGKKLLDELRIFCQEPPHSSTPSTPEEEMPSTESLLANLRPAGTEVAAGKRKATESDTISPSIDAKRRKE